MRMRTRVLAVAVCLMLTGCSKPRIDTTSDEALAKSMKRVVDSLSDEERKRFQEATMVLTFSLFGDTGGLLAFAANPELVKAAALKPLHGMTADAVIAEADRITAERKAKERAQALGEIKELEQKKAAAQRAAAELEKFEVLKSRFQVRRGGFMPEPVIELTVRNGTEHAVSRAYFVGTVTSPGRSVPWLKEDFNYSIRGGLEPGETATWRLAPNSFSAWGKVETKPEMVFTVETKKLAGPDAKTLYDADFGADSEARLAALKREHAAK